MGEHEALMARKHTVRLRPLTPIHVWSGQKLVVGFDLVRLKDNRICVVDTDKIPNSVVERLVKVDVKSIPGILAESSSSLICKQIILSDIDLSSIMASARENVMVQELDHYIVPGSTLKGYIRTAILYHLLNRLIRADPKKAENIINSGLNLHEKPKNVSIGLEASLFRAPRPQIRKKGSKQTPAVGGFVDAFQSLLVSDPYVKVSPECYKLTEMFSYELLSRESKGLKLIGSQYVIVATCGELVYNVKIVKPLDIGDVNKRIDRAVKIGDISHERAIEKISMLSKEDILSALREFGCQILSLEISRIEKIHELRQYYEFLLRYKEKYCDEKKDKCVIARIGFGCGVYSKTVLSLIKNHYPRMYNQIVNYMSTRIGHAWDEKTLKLVYLSKSLTGPGWCELCLE